MGVCTRRIEEVLPSQCLVHVRSSARATPGRRQTSTCALWAFQKYSFIEVETEND